MKKEYLIIAISAILISIILASCSSMNYLTIGVTEPAPVYLSSKIQTVGVIDRSLPTEKIKNIDILDKILSIEGKDLDKDAAQKAVSGLYDELKTFNRFVSVKMINNSNIKSPGIGAFPPVLTWDQVNQICKDNNVEGLFVLSFYDTDASIDYKTIPVEVNGPLGVKVQTVETQATINTRIKTGWRIYNPVNKVIADEYIINRNVVSSGRGINPLKAAYAIIGRKDAVLNTSNKIGHSYAPRILPFNIRVSRQYYVRGTNNFKIGKRRAQTGDWNGAAVLWEKELANPEGKIAGRACYNMAIINEINGDLYQAVDWASKSYTDYNNKKALHYINILKKRIAKNEQLQREN